MELREFRDRYRDAQVQFRNRLQTIAIALEILITVDRPFQIKSALWLLFEEMQQVMQECDRIDSIVEEYLSAQEGN
ncbi:MAG: hypothetical protein QNJ46_03990 [Leptolyngbyaceae cyanobacterium MO_188.B28]|nr:hypothetical protein [Leptolyngbyaceae cyanobacterium MO_188.B28]